MSVDEEVEKEKVSRVPRDKKKSSLRREVGGSGRIGSDRIGSNTPPKKLISAQARLQTIDTHTPSRKGFAVLPVDVQLEHSAPALLEIRGQSVSAQQQWKQNAGIEQTGKSKWRDNLKM